MNGLAAVVAETEVNCARTIEAVEHAIDRFLRERCVFRTAGNVRLVHLQTGGRQTFHLRRQQIRDGEGE